MLNRLSRLLTIDSTRGIFSQESEEELLESPVNIVGLHHGGTKDQNEGRVRALGFQCMSSDRIPVAKTDLPEQAFSTCHTEGSESRVQRDGILSYAVPDPSRWGQSTVDIALLFRSVRAACNRTTLTLLAQIRPNR